MLEALASRRALEDLTIESAPASFVAPDGTTTRGNAGATIRRSSIAIRFVPDAALVVPKAAYGESNGSIVARDEAWWAGSVGDAGTAEDGTHLFSTMTLAVGRGQDERIAATRLVVAGGAWSGTGMLNGMRVIAQPLSRDVVSHHDRRMSITIEGSIDESLIEAMGRAASFVCGIDVEILRVERYACRGLPIRVEHRRGYRRIGRGTHSPFVGVPDSDRMRAWIALVEAFPRLLRDGVPIDMIVDQISAHNQVAQIHVSAPLLLLATLTAAYHATHGGEVVAGAASRRAELEFLDRELNLGLSEEDLDRFEKLRLELLDAGFFHKPGYETGRPQRDIKFLRDLAHVVVFRLCGYFGPFYGAERFTVRELTLH